MWRSRHLCNCMLGMGRTRRLQNAAEVLAADQQLAQADGLLLSVCQCEIVNYSTVLGLRVQSSWCCDTVWLARVYIYTVTAAVVLLLMSGSHVYTASHGLAYCVPNWQYPSKSKPTSTTVLQHRQGCLPQYCLTSLHFCMQRRSACRPHPWLQLDGPQASLSQPNHHSSHSIMPSTGIISHRWTRSMVVIKRATSLPPQPDSARHSLLPWQYCH
jgi:hypothetical protein